MSLNHNNFSPHQLFLYIAWIVLLVQTHEVLKKHSNGGTVYYGKNVLYFRYQMSLENDVIYLPFSSTSSGAKGIMHTHKSLMASFYSPDGAANHWFDQLIGDRWTFAVFGFSKWAIPEFSNKHQCHFYNQLMWQNVHPIYGAGIQTHYLQITSLIP